MYYTPHVQAKIKFYLCLLKQHSMKTYREAKVQLHAFLNSALDGDEMYNKL